MTQLPVSRTPSLLKVALSSADAVQKRVGVSFVAIRDLDGQHRFSLQVDGVYLQPMNVNPYVLFHSTFAQLYLAALSPHLPWFQALVVVIISSSAGSVAGFCCYQQLK